MEIKKNIGVWMDHSIAHLIELQNNWVIRTTIESKFTHLEKELSLRKNENLMLNKEQHEQAGYYKKITEAIKEYTGIVLFGPTKAKNELMNLLSADHHFVNAKIEVKQADKMSENQEKAFVKEYFYPHK
jgi:hypothetical protein